MAQSVKVELVDDLDGSEATETVSFGLDGAEYDIDLNDEHADQLRMILAPLVAAARRTGGRLKRGRGAAARAATADSESGIAPTSPTTPPPPEFTDGETPPQERQERASLSRTAALARQPATMDREQRRAIREWGRSHGFTVADRGRFAEDLIAAYDEAHTRRRRGR